MKLVYTGKTKDVYDPGDGSYILKFKDDMTGENGVFDPGANQVGLVMEGAGRAGLRLTAFFFEVLNGKGIPTHYLDADPGKAIMRVKPAAVFGKGIEIICRYRAVGSFYRRYGMYVEEGQPLDCFVEITLKDDERQDPPATEDALVMLGILTREEYAAIVALAARTGRIVREELAKRDIELYDIKFEFGRTPEENRIMLIDEISGGNMRAYRDNRRLEPLELEAILLPGDGE
ncbi:MAG: phosphoribosylaminoimidazolesuccinocarboxamide synthase [Clostridia bacterium]